MPMYSAEKENTLLSLSASDDKDVTTGAVGANGERQEKVTWSNMSSATATEGTTTTIIIIITTIITTTTTTTITLLLYNYYIYTDI